jgi:hypothetical protein
VAKNPHLVSAGIRISETGCLSKDSKDLPRGGKQFHLGEVMVETSICCGYQTLPSTTHCYL